MTPAPSFWSSFLVWTAAEVAAIALLATMAQWFVRAPAGRKIIWRVALLVTFLTLTAESSGLLSGAGQWLRHQVAPTTAAARVMTVTVTSDPATLAELSVKPVVTQPTPWQLTPEPAPVWWPLWIWLAGMGLVVGYHAMGGLLILRLKRRMQPVVEAGLVARMNEIAARLGLKTRVQLYESRAAPCPFTYGWWRPAICLPPDFTGDFNSMQQDAILAHELSHIAGRDFLWQRLSNGLAGLLWWHPMVWWMRHQLATASEHAADEASLVVPNGSEALAESLLALGRKMSRGWQPVLLGVEGAGFRSKLAKRVQCLWSLRGQPFGADRRRLMAPVIAGGILTLCSLTLVAAILPRDIGANGAWRNSLIAMAADTLRSPPTAPVVAPPQTSAVTDKRALLKERLAQIIIPKLAYDDVRLEDVVKDLLEKVLKADPQQRGVPIMLSEHASPDSELKTIPYHIWDATVRIPGMTNATMLVILNELVKSAKPELKYAIEDYGVVISRRELNAPGPLYTRVFRVDANTFYQGLQGVKPLSVGATGGGADAGIARLTATNSTALGGIVRAFFEAHGVTINPPKAVFFNDRTGLLMVRATLNDLDSIETALTRLNQPPPQIMIEIRICDVPSDLLQPGEMEKLLGIKLTNAVANAGAVQLSPTNAAASSLLGTLTAEQAPQVLRLLEKRSGVDMLSAPKVTTLSGRQAQVKIVDIKQIVTDLKPKSGTNSPTVNKQSGEVVDDVVPVTEPFECGISVDVVPTVLTDGKTIRLGVIPGIREFLGYDDVQDTREPFPRIRKVPWPRFRVRQYVCTADLLDGQTLIIAGGADFEEVINRGGSEVHPPKAKPAKSLLIFVTPRLIDESGNPSNR